MKKILFVLSLVFVCAQLTACSTAGDITKTKIEPETRDVSSFEIAEEKRGEKTGKGVVEQQTEDEVEEMNFIFSPLDVLDGVEVLGLLYAQRALERGGNEYSVIEKVYLAKKDDKYGLLNTEGEWVCAPQYAQITYAYNYFLESGLDDYSDKYSIDTSGCIYKISDPSIVIGTCSDPTSVWCGNKSRMMLAAGGDCTIEDMDFVYEGTVSVREIIYDFDESGGEYLPTERDGYAICTDGKLRTDFLYESTTAFFDGLIAVRKDGKWGYVDANGQEVIPCIYDSIRYDRSAYVEAEFGFAASCPAGYVVLAQNGEYALADREGTIVIPFGEYEVLTEVQKRGMYAKKDGKWGYLSLNSEKEHMEKMADLTIEDDKGVQEIFSEETSKELIDLDMISYDGIRGSHFEIPSSFIQNTDARHAAGGYVYEFMNHEIGMQITVSECAFTQIACEDPSVIISRDYLNTYEWLNNSENCHLISHEKNAWSYSFEWSYENQYNYSKNINRQDNDYIDISITYSLDNKDECMEIQTRFLESFMIKP